MQLPKPLWKRVKQAALDRSVTATQIVVDAVEKRLEQLDKKAAKELQGIGGK